MNKVAKFGGSSLADAVQFRKVAAIVKGDPDRRVIIVSACGKSVVEREKVTDLLYRLYACIQGDRGYEEIWESIVNRYVTIRDELGMVCDIESELVGIYNRLEKDVSVEWLVSRGEYLCALLMAEYLGYSFIDATKVLFFHEDGILDREKSKYALGKILEDHSGIVVPGFYGAFPNGEIHTLGRGGSDVSGSMIADLMEAELYENWSDVSGIFMVDPRIIPEAVKCSHISYQKVRELSHLGANILHEDTIFPLLSRNISLVIRNTNAPQDPGTLVTVQEIDPCEICGITGKKGYSLLRVYKEELSIENDWLLTITNTLRELPVSIEYIRNSIDHYTIVFKEVECIDTLLSSLPDNYEHIHSLAILGIVGNTLEPRRIERALASLHDSEIEVYYSSQDPHPSTCIFLVNDRQLEESIKTLYYAFLG
ncbi:MAG: hypothetical protein IKL88_01080 [Erysipelotrichales bacterium]|nr:hypothetical protein [Erysipelotrichales bacterium]